VIKRNTKLTKAIRDTLEAYRECNTLPRLLGKDHDPRAMILPGLAKLIPNELKSSMYFTGQGQLPIIPTGLARNIAKALNVPMSVIAVKL
jgi:hypothetical protein